MTKIQETVSKYKYPLLVLAVGVLLLMWPQSGGDDAADNSQEQRLEAVLESCVGVGECSVLLSDNGAVIVCDGADSAETKYGVLKAVEAYSGFSSDKIQILKRSVK